jgi:hypothetical protein
VLPVSPPSCLAVGVRFSAYSIGVAPPYAFPYALIENYNGYSWVQEPGPALAGRLMGVGCAASECMAVGMNQIGRAEVGIAVTKDTYGWAAATPTKAYARDPLLSISCGLRTKCVAVGDDANSNGVAILDWKEGWSYFRSSNGGTVPGRS